MPTNTEEPRLITGLTYAWGVRWQPFGLPGCELYDANRPLIAKQSSYAQFWVAGTRLNQLKRIQIIKSMSGQLRN